MKKMDCPRCCYGMYLHYCIHYWTVYALYDYWYCLVSKHLLEMETVSARAVLFEAASFYVGARGDPDSVMLEEQRVALGGSVR